MNNEKDPGKSKSEEKTKTYGKFNYIVRDLLQACIYISFYALCLGGCYSCQKFDENSKFVDKGYQQQVVDGKVIWVKIKAEEPANKQ